MNSSSSVKMLAVMIASVLLGCTVETSSSSTEKTNDSVDQNIFVDDTLYRTPRLIVGTVDSFTPDQLGTEKGSLGQECGLHSEDSEEGSCSSPELACRKEDNKCWCDCTSGSFVLDSSPCTQMCEHTSCLIQNMTGSTDSKPVFGRLELYTRSDKLTEQYFDPKEGRLVDLGVWNCLPFEPSQKCETNKGGCAVGLECVGNEGNESCQCDCFAGQNCHDSEFSLPSMTQQGVDHCTAVCEKQLCGFKFNPSKKNDHDPLSALTPMFLTCKQPFPGESLHWNYSCQEDIKTVELK